MFLKAPAHPLRSCILLAFLLLVIAAIVPVCIAAGVSGDLEIPASDPAAPAECGTERGGGPAVDASGYCTQPGAINVKVTINPSVALPTTTVTYNSENPPKGVAPPKTTTPGSDHPAQYNACHRANKDNDGGSGYDAHHAAPHAVPDNCPAGIRGNGHVHPMP